MQDRRKLHRAECDVYKNELVYGICNTAATSTWITKISSQTSVKKFLAHYLSSLHKH